MYRKQVLSRVPADAPSKLQSISLLAVVRNQTVGSSDASHVRRWDFSSADAKDPTTILTLDLISPSAKVQSMGIIME
jgi:hypothetical protein